MKHKKQTNSYLDTNKQYLVKIKDIYYFCFRYGKKIIKYSLKSTNLYQSNIIKLKLIKRLKMKTEFDNIFNNKELRNIDSYIDTEENPTIVEDIEKKIINIINKYKETISKSDIDYLFDNKTKYSIESHMDKDEDPETIRRIEKDIIELLNKERELGNIKSLSYNSENITKTTLKEGFEHLYDFKKNNDKLGESSLSKYLTSYKYLLLFCEEDKLIFTFNKQFFKDTK